MDINDAVTGWETASWENYKETFLWERRMYNFSRSLSRPGPVKKKPFIPKNNLPRLNDYSVDPPESYWECWPKVLFSESDHKSWIDPQEFMDTALEAGYKDINHVQFIKQYPERGADIGCEREGRLPTFGKNNVLSVSDNGFEVADEIVSWLKMDPSQNLNFHSLTTQSVP